MKNNILAVCVALVVGIVAGAFLAGAVGKPTPPKPRGESAVIREGDPVNVSVHGAGVESQFHRLKVVPRGSNDPNKTAEWIVTVGPADDSQVFVLTAR